MFSRGNLRHLVAQVSQKALHSGALVPLESEEEFIKEGELDIQVRILKALRDKAKATSEQKKEKRNPFLPFEQDLFVSELTSNYVIVLNKFPVLQEHGLIITREFVQQTLPLLPDDFHAINLVLQEDNYLVFFNSGAIAGASQQHKHIQFVPLPIVDITEPGKQPLETCISPLFEKELDHSTFECPQGQLPFYDFLHAVELFPEYKIDLASDKIVNEYADQHYNSYISIMKKFSEKVPEGQCENGQYVGPYNFLMTRKWMLIVPRREEYFNGVSANSMVFAGAVLVKTQKEKDNIVESGFIRILKELTFPNQK